MNLAKKIGFAVGLGLALLVSTSANASPVKIVLSPSWTDLGTTGSPLSVEWIGKSNGNDVYNYATVTYSPSPAHVWSYDGNITNQSAANIKTVVETKYGISGLTLVSQCDNPTSGCSGGASATANNGANQFVSDGYDYLAIHFGQGELLFHWLYNLHDVTFEISGLPKGLSNYRAYTDGNEPPPPPPVPLPAAAWLFGSALLGFVSLSNRRKI
jgi:hypothetical protein